MVVDSSCTSCGICHCLHMNNARTLIGERDLNGTRVVLHRTVIHGRTEWTVTILYRGDPTARTFTRRREAISYLDSLA